MRLVTLVGAGQCQRTMDGVARTDPVHARLCVQSSRAPSPDPHGGAGRCSAAGAALACFRGRQRCRGRGLARDVQADPGGGLRVEGECPCEAHGPGVPWLTVQQTVKFGPNDDEHGDKAVLADHYATMVRLKGFENSDLRELSGGMLKRVELARALVVKREILYMGEPFSALDALMNLKMRTELLRILE